MDYPFPHGRQGIGRGYQREEILQVKREEITEKVQESIHKRGNRPCFFILSLPTQLMF